VSFLAITLPVSLLLAASLVGLVIWAVRQGAFDDFEGPAWRHHFDDDRAPERDGTRDTD
jgi:cbb3-type cytochrome oxidase maturation protein